MSERPDEPAPFVQRQYGELRCRRYLFDRPFGEEPPPPSDPAAGGPVRPAPRAGRADDAERAQ